MPKYITSECRDFLTKILKKDPKQRLGYGGAHEIKTHRFFRKIDWKKLEEREAVPPIIPSTKGVEENFSASVSFFHAKFLIRGQIIHLM